MPQPGTTSARPSLASTRSALLAVVRATTHDKAFLQRRVFLRLNALPWSELSPEQQLDALRVYAVAFARLGRLIPEIARGILESHLTGFDLSDINWSSILEATVGLSQAEVSRAADEAAKIAVLEDRSEIRTPTLLSTLAERRAATS